MPIPSPENPPMITSLHPKVLPMKAIVAIDVNTATNCMIAAAVVALAEATTRRPNRSEIPMKRALSPPKRAPTSGAPLVEPHGWAPLGASWCCHQGEVRTPDLIEIRRDRFTRWIERSGTSAGRSGLLPPFDQGGTRHDVANP